MEHLVLGLVWLPRILASVSLKCGRELDMEMLHMAPNSFDDQYKGCSHEMEKELKELNRTEFVPNSNYAMAWKKATAKWQKQKPHSVLKPVQAIALTAYTLETPPLYREFNAAVRRAGRSPEEYRHNFPYKGLHFLLTEALRALRDAQHPQCYDVYRGVKKTFSAQPGETVRFGQFASTSLDKKCAEWFGKGTVFSVTTCYGVPIWDFSVYAGEKEVLIPPFEKFEVTSVTDKGNSRIIQLQSQGVHSNYNCEYVGGGEQLLPLAEKQCMDKLCDFSAGQSVTLAPLWGFLLAATALATAVGV